MSLDLATVLFLLALAIGMFALNRPRMDAVALIMLVALQLTGILTVPEALAGFSDPGVVLIGSLFVIGEGLVRTGIARRLGDWLAGRAGGNGGRLVALLMLIVAALGSVMSSTGVVALFIPVVLRIAARLRMAPGQLMMPLSFAALISGMLTLVGTPPNLVVSSELQRAGHAGFGFFSFTPFGLPILLLGIGYMLVARRWLGRAEADETAHAAGPTLSRLVEDYRLGECAHHLRVGSGSPLAGRSLEVLQLHSQHGLNVMAVERPKRGGIDLLDPTGETVVRPGDLLAVHFTGAAEQLRMAVAELGLHPVNPDGFDPSGEPRAIGLAEVIIPPDSSLRGKSVLEGEFRSRFGLTVVGLRRGRTAWSDGLLEERLQTGDTLLLVGPWEALRRSQRGKRDFVLLNHPEDLEEISPAADRAPQALLSLGVVVLLMVSGLVPHVLAALIGCLIMLSFRCIDLDGAYRSIHWPTVILIAGMLPFSLALQKTGGIALAAEGLIRLVGDAGPHALLASLFAATAVTGLFISNTATAVLMAPVAIATAQQLGLSPHPFAMTVALSASAAFMTPVSSPVNTLVLGPGRYRFGDFVRIGVPFTLLVMAVTLVLVPWLLPLK
ncbi:SLC13 family permease [Teichococcus oryzae]|uniref:SLC13 family permease n=1 Tax=Teichococcus oryzae TaxID=1608942 RepID=A0A5B2TJH9_9PROT|nr:SLC13 family permease [Pseudoroseomonas oryzae]KAA2214667.1 SLC13 family permease [Pseudoroseomonas oryzae]